MTQVSNEEIAHKIVHLYFAEVARLGIKRKLDLDEVVQAYFYTLGRLNAGASSAGNAKDHSHSPKPEDAGESSQGHSHETVHVTVSHDAIEREAPHQSGDLAPPVRSTESASTHSRSFHS